MNEVLEQISKTGIVPVIALDDAKDAEPLAGALCRGGLPCAEVTFRTAAAEESIRIMAKNFPHMLVGAGTVLTTEQADRAAAAGAKFIVSPGLNPKVVKHCQDKGIQVLPGCATPTEIEQALDLGLNTVKFFPAEAAGGLAMIKAMSAPYTAVKFMPTGGINANNLNEYLSFGKIIACGGSWMVKKDLVAAGDFDGITALTRQAVTKMLGFAVDHIGVSRGYEEIGSLLGSDFGIDSGVTVTGADRGTSGEITVSTNFIERAVYHLGLRGIHTDTSTEQREKGRLVSVSLAGEYGGFAVRLIQK